MKTENLSQRIAVAEHITPAAARAAGSYVSAAIPAAKFARLLAILQTGTLTGAATIQAKWQHCSASASSLAGWANIDATAVTSAFVSGSNDKLGELELQLDQHPTISAFVRILASAAVSSWLGGCIIIGESRFRPATEQDTADVVQTVIY